MGSSEALLAYLDLWGTGGDALVAACQVAARGSLIGVEACLKFWGDSEETWGTFSALDDDAVRALNDQVECAVRRHLLSRTGSLPAPVLLVSVMERPGRGTEGVRLLARMAALGSAAAFDVLIRETGAAGGGQALWRLDDFDLKALAASIDRHAKSTTSRQVMYDPIRSLVAAAELDPDAVRVLGRLAAAGSMYADRSLLVLWEPHREDWMPDVPVGPGVFEQLAMDGSMAGIRLLARHHADSDGTSQLLASFSGRHDVAPAVTHVAAWLEWAVATGGEAGARGVDQLLDDGSFRHQEVRSPP